MMLKKSWVVSFQYQHGSTDSLQTRQAERHQQPLQSMLKQQQHVFCFLMDIKYE